ncbi:MAG: translation initiation factor IF-2, partial [Candidatus Kerfeldbacteria bacterium]|nr:translation initiation factor IF-2 [Candidatus Kerfeldbacteria bacterium]
MADTATIKKRVEIPKAVVIKDLAALLELPVTTVITELMKNGVMSSMNERIDYDTAAVIAEDLGFAAAHKETSDDENEQTVAQELAELLKQDDSAVQIKRPPVVVVMGHVDHGKTKLLDAIRSTDVAASEAGGITQHIGAYQVTVPAKSALPSNKRSERRAITFIDTPGHEAFTAMRSRGARVADVAILVVAADDGIKPQTKEAVQIIQQSDLPLLVAINKIDKPEANIERVKQQLAELNLLPEDWGGKIPTVPVSATTRAGVDDLLETVLLLADVEEGHLKADPTRPAVGTVIEAHIDKGEGPVATVVVQTGTLRKGDYVKISGVIGRVKALRDWHGIELADASPSTPAKMLGLKSAPEVGDILRVIPAEEAKKLRREIKPKTERVRTKVVYQKKSEQATKVPAVQREKLNIVLRCDNLGSQEAILESLQKYESAPVGIEVVAKGLGSITEADVLRAGTAKAFLLGFHVVPTQRAVEVAKGKHLTITTYTVIYDLLDAVHKELEQRLPVEIAETVTGHLRVLAVFKKEKKGQIIGGKVIDGVATRGSAVRV